MSMCSSLSKVERHKGFTCQLSWRGQPSSSMGSLPLLRNEDLQIESVGQPGAVWVCLQSSISIVSTLAGLADLRSIVAG